MYKEQLRRLDLVIGNFVMTLSVVIRTTPTEVEFVSDLLWSLGVVAIEEHWDPNGVVRLQTSLGDDVEVVNQAMNSLPVVLDWSTTTVNETVANTWREFAQPTVIGRRIVIAPVWCAEQEVAEAVASLPDPNQAMVISIEPASTVGMGDHPTTMSSLLMIEKYLKSDDVLIDVGCGSGVLGIGALRMGASRAIGMDINPSCVPVSQENARLNQVSDRWSVTTEPVAVIGFPANIVVANILAPALIELSGELKRLTRPDGVLIISGVLAEHYEHVAKALEPLHEFDRIEHGGWAAVAFRRI
jgi:ribosomal protein L11 methyltransferase